jgi:hypothetical protein
VAVQATLAWEEKGGGDKHDTSETFSVREWSGKEKRMTFNLLG